MTKRVTARPVNTFTQPTGMDSRDINHRASQVGRAFQNLGVLFKQRSNENFDEAKEDVQAKVDIKATALAADYMPRIKEAMKRPETFEQDADSFLKSDVYKMGEESLNELSDYPHSHKKFTEAYRASMLKMFQEGKAAHDHKKLAIESDKAQLTSANLGGSQAQLSSFDAAVKAGVNRDDAFTTALAVASIKGASYTGEIAKDKRWTPTERLRLERQAAKLKNEEKAKKTAADEELKFNALTTLDEAKNIQGRQEQADALRSAASKYGDIYTTSQKARITADVSKLEKEVAVEHEVRGKLGVVSTKRLAEGVGTKDNYRLPLGDIKRIQNEETMKAIKSGNAARLISLASIPEDTPEVLSDTFNNVFSQVDAYDPNDPNTSGIPQKVKDALTNANFITDNLGSGRMRSILGDHAYADYQDLKTLSSYYGTKSAVEQFKLSRQLAANGATPTPEDWNENKDAVTSYALDELGSQFWKANDSHYGEMNRASLNSQLAPMFRIWKKMNLSKSEMKNRVGQLVKDSQWGGYLNGRTLGQAVNKLTIGKGGNPYGDRDATALLDSYREAVTKDMKKDLPDLKGIELIIGNDPNTVFLYDKSGMIVPNGIRSITDITDYIRKNIPTNKQKEKDEYNAEQRWAAKRKRWDAQKERWDNDEEGRKQHQKSKFGFTAELKSL